MMNGALCKHSYKDWALLALRLAAGIIFIYHGYGKLFGGSPGMEMFTGMVGKIGFPMAGFFAYAAALSEFVGGIALILGIFTRVAAALVGIVMIVAFVIVKHFALPAGDADLSLLAIALALFLMGPGALSIACGWKKDESGMGCCAHPHEKPKA